MTGKESTAGGANTLTDAQMKFLASMMKNNKSKPDVDWDAVAAENGGITVKAVKERYRIMSHKFGWNASSKNGEGSTATATGNTPKKPTGVTKRAGRVGATANKGKTKKTIAMEADDSDNMAEVAKTEADDDSAGEA